MVTAGVPKGKQKRTISTPFNRRLAKYQRSSRSIPFHMRTTITKAAQPKASPITMAQKEQPQETFIQAGQRIIEQKEQPKRIVSSSTTTATTTATTTEVNIAPPTSVEAVKGSSGYYVTEPVAKTITSSGWIEQARDDVIVMAARKQHVEEVGEITELKREVRAIVEEEKQKKRVMATGLIGKSVFGGIKTGTSISPELAPPYIALGYTPTIKEYETELRIQEDTLKEIEIQAGKKKEGDIIQGYLLVKKEPKTFLEAGQNQYTIIPKTFMSPESAILAAQEIREKIIEPEKLKLSKVERDIMAWAEEEPKVMVEHEVLQPKGDYQNWTIQKIVDEGRWTIEKQTAEITAAQYERMLSREQAHSTKNLNRFITELESKRKQEYVFSFIPSVILGYATGGTASALLWGAASIPATFMGQETEKRTGNELLAMGVSTATFLVSEYGLSKLAQKLTTTAVTMKTLKSVHGVEVGKTSYGTAKTSGIAEVKGFFGTKEIPFKQKGIYAYTETTTYGGKGFSMTLTGQKTSEELLTKGVVETRRTGLTGWISKKLGISTKIKTPFISSEELSTHVVGEATYRFRAGSGINILEAVPTQSYTTWAKSEGVIATSKGISEFTSASRTPILEYPSLRGVYEGKTFSETLIKGGKITDTGSSIIYKIKKLPETISKTSYGFTSPKLPTLIDLRETTIKIASTPRAGVTIGKSNWINYDKSLQMAMLQPKPQLAEILTKSMEAQTGYAIEQVYFSQAITETVFFGALAYSGMKMVSGYKPRLATLQTIAPIQIQRSELMQIPAIQAISKAVTQPAPTSLQQSISRPIKTFKPQVKTIIPRIETGITTMLYSATSTILEQIQVPHVDLVSVQSPTLKPTYPQFAITGFPTTPSIPATPPPIIPPFWMPSGSGGRKKGRGFWDLYGLKIHSFFEWEI